MANAPPQTAGKQTNYKDHPERYRIGRGELGIFHTPPYTELLLPLWRFREPALATESAKAIFAHFERFREQEDFVGMDMARKFLQMGVTRSRRYARHPGGRKYGPDQTLLPTHEDPVKHESARIFAAALAEVRKDEAYQAAKICHQRLVRAL